MSERTLEVYKSIAAITAELAKEGISKDNFNQGQKYKFRGIDDVLNALSSKLAAQGLVIIPRVTDRWCEERETNSGGRMAYVTVRVEYDFVSSKDGSVHTAVTFGEAMDSADKATNKAMSASYKYLALLAFCIPTEGDNDADATTHEVKPKAKQEPPKKSEDAEWIKQALTENQFVDFKTVCGQKGVKWPETITKARAQGVTDAEGLFLFLEGGAK